MREYPFFAMMSRMKYIERWALMRNAEKENISEHSLDVAMIAHSLCIIANARLGKQLNAERAVLLGVYHDCTEILTGDMPTPIKYYNNEICSAFHEIEVAAAEKMLAMLPEDMRSYYSPLLVHEEKDDYLWKLLKAADKISALTKCVKEKKMGNTEFDSAYQTLYQAITDMGLPEVTIFFEEFMPAYEKTLDELNLS